MAGHQGPSTLSCAPAWEEANSSAHDLQSRILACLRATQRELQQKDGFRMLQPSKSGLREIVDTVLAHVKLDVLTASCLIKALARTDEAHLSFTTTDWLLETQPELGGTDEVLHAAITAAATTCPNPDTALRYYHLRSCYGLGPSLESANMAVTACSHLGRVEDALRVLKDLQAEGLDPPAYAVLMVIQAANFKKRGRCKEAVEAYKCLPKGVPAPSNVLDALLSVFEAAIHKASTLDEVQTMFCQLADVRLADSTRAYNAVLKACASRGCWQLAREYFDAMVEEDVPADTDTFNALIESCLKGGAVEAALDIFEWLVSSRDIRERIPADVRTYNTLIKVCHQAGMLEKALEIANWVLQSDVSMDKTTYQELISTIEVAQLWDAKVFSHPFYQQTPGRFHCETPADTPKRSETPEEELDSLPAASQPTGRTLFEMANASMAASGRGFVPSLASSLRRFDKLPSPAPTPPTPPPPEPLAIFPKQLRPAPFDGLRIMYLDHLQSLEQEAVLAAVKLKSQSWAPRILMKGGSGPDGKGHTMDMDGMSAADAFHRYPSTEVGKLATPPKLPKLYPLPEPVHLSRAPSFRQKSLENWSRGHQNASKPTVPVPAASPAARHGPLQGPSLDMPAATPKS